MGPDEADLESMHVCCLVIRRAAVCSADVASKKAGMEEHSRFCQRFCSAETPLSAKMPLLADLQTLPQPEQCVRVKLNTALCKAFTEDVSSGVGVTEMQLYGQ